jgi:hypothetical protein
MAKKSSSTLSAVMECFLTQVDQGICITLSSADGIELMCGKVYSLTLLIFLTNFPLNGGSLQGWSEGVCDVRCGYPNY